MTQLSMAVVGCYVLLTCTMLWQLDEETAAQVVSWMPKKLAPQVRCVFSMINDTPQHKALVAKDEDILVVPVTPLSVDDRKVITCMHV